MTDEHTNIVLEHLRAIRAKQDEHSERLTHIEVRLSAIEQTLGTMYVVGASDREALAALTRRVERLERRLELREDAP
jgi:polyhydroxyalkanoate synthesis regulator phasin